MPAVPVSYAAYLAAPARYVTATVPGSVAAWGDKALDSTILSPFAVTADAQDEANRQIAFLAGPLARDKHIVKGLRADLIGKLITLTGRTLGYAGAGSLAFVIGAAETENGGTTTLTVLKRLT